MLLEMRLSKVTLTYTGLLILQYAVLFIIAYVTDRVVEWVTMIPLFFTYTKRFNKQSHCETLFKCSTATTIIVGLSFILMPSKNEFIFTSVITVYIITVVSYYVRDYADKCKLLEKKLESLTFDEMCQRFPDYSVSDLKCIYAYVNRGNALADNIAMKYGYSTRQIQRIIRKMRGRL